MYLVQCTIVKHDDEKSRITIQIPTFHLDAWKYYGITNPISVGLMVRDIVDIGHIYDVGVCISDDSGNVFSFHYDRLS